MCHELFEIPENSDLFYIQHIPPPTLLIYTRTCHTQRKMTLMKILKVKFISISRISAIKTTHYIIHVMEFGTINWAFYNLHGHVTIQWKDRKGTVLDSSVEGDVVYSCLSTRGTTVPSLHYVLILAGFIKKHQLVCCVVCGHIQNLFHAIGIGTFSCNPLEMFVHGQDPVNSCAAL